MDALEQVARELDEAKERRKNGEMDERGFYAALLGLSARLVPILIQEAEDASMKAADIRKQIPLILAFLEDQIARYRVREAQH